MKSRIYEFDPTIYPLKVHVTKDFDEAELKEIYKVLDSDNKEVDATDEFSNTSDITITARVVYVAESVSGKIRYLVLLFQPKVIRVGTAAHEAVHIANAYLQYLGFSCPSAYNDEPYAYFVQWVTNCIWSVLVDNESSMNGELLEIKSKEINEGEDERIINNIKKAVESYWSDEPLQEILDWLEKKSTPQIRTGLEWVNTIDDACDKRYAEEYAHGEYCHEQSFKWGFQEGVDWLEKQDEQKPKGDIDNLHNYLYGEQKLADKVNPKFNVDDYIKHNKANIICKIISVNSGSYYVENIRTNNRIELFNVEQNFHLWTIQDAKDGDVLVDTCDSLDNPLIFILKDFKHTKHELCTLSDYHSFCFLKASKRQEFCVDGWHNEHNLKPATKEQHDLLFQKMKEAGYEWDAEKKELKKIEQNPAWSEEDETKIKSIIALLKSPALCAMDGNKGIIEENIKYLKSLKERYTCKPSDEQMKALKKACDEHWEPDGLEPLYTLYQDLKKLREE